MEVVGHTRGGCRRRLVLGGEKAVEVHSYRVDAPLARLGRGNAARRRIATARGIHERHGVVGEIGAVGANDPPDQGLLPPPAGDEVLELARPERERAPRRQPRLQEPWLTGEDEAALSRLEIEQQPLERV